MRTISFSAVLLALPIAFGQERSSLPAATASKLETAVTAEIEKQSLVGAAVGVIENGKVAYVKGFGLADREKNTPASERTIFNWASNSKPLAGVMAMQLVEKGLLDLDADVRTYVPEFPAKDKPITTRQLLCHTSGVPHYTNGKVVRASDWPFKGDEMDPLVGLARFAESRLIFSPGDKSAYSSHAYVLLSAVIQRAGKEPFADQVRKRIAEPIGMPSFQWDVATNGQPNWSVGYSRNQKSGKISVAKEDAHAWKHGAGGFKSDVRDFAAWAAALTQHKLLKPATEKQMWTNQKTNDGKTIGYGLGFGVARTGELTVSHGGAQGETKTYMVVQPNLKRGVVVMSNSGYANPGDIATAVRTAVWGEPKKAKTN